MSQSTEEGLDTERVFRETLRKEGHIVTRASKKDDMGKHIDCYIDGKGYDIKGKKRLNRGDKHFSDIIWLESVNSQGNPGWLYGEMDYIAFHIEDYFAIIPQEDLMRWVDKNIPIKEGPFDIKGYKLWFFRRNSLITYVYLEDIEHLIIKKILI